MLDHRSPAPELSLSDIVASAWNQVLDKRSLEADMPFDQAGGDSLRLLKLIFLLEEESGLRLPMEACHVSLRPSGFAAVLDLARRLGDGNAMEQPGTVFLIPGLGGQSQLEGGFVAACAPDLHVALVDLPDWPEMMASDFCMEDLIDRCAAEISARMPDGRLRLAGYSLGGHIAFGAARQLAARGRTISFFGILDTRTVPSEPIIARGPTPIRMLRYFRWELHNLIKAARRGATADKMGELTAQFLTQPGKSGRLRLAARWRHMRLPSSYAMYVNIYLREALQIRMLRAWRVGRDHRAARLQAPVVLFRSEEHTHDEAAHLGWDALCADIRIVNVSGGHRTMLRVPHLENLSSAFVRAVEGEVRATAQPLVA